jgi:hypothetical protein
MSKLAFGDQYKKWRVDASKVHGGCGLTGVMSQDGNRMAGDMIIESTGATG